MHPVASLVCGVGATADSGRSHAGQHRLLAAGGARAVFGVPVRGVGVLGGATPCPWFLAPRDGRVSVDGASVWGARRERTRAAQFGFPRQTHTPRRARRHTVEFAKHWGLDDLVEVLT